MHFFAVLFTVDLYVLVHNILVHVCAEGGGKSWKLWVKGVETQTLPATVKADFKSYTNTPIFVTCTVSQQKGGMELSRAI